MEDDFEFDEQYLTKRIQQLVEQSQAFAFLYDEEELYTIKDIKH